ncbi:MAG TPA: translation initiation factor IF-2 [Patescibacteria group bacterium]|nr:translation initiation factor IF-2 [Patescibacteria group bacterium]
MNLTELARRLKITPQELRDILPRMGFSVGQKAIKVDNHTAQKVMREWPKYKKQLEREEREKEREEAESEDDLPKEKKKVEVGKYITIRDFASIAGIAVNKVLSTLMKNGVFASINEKIDYDTASIVSDELEIEVVPKEAEEEFEKKENEKSIEDVLEAEEDDSLEERAPVVVVMGHVDHGKTALLDAIRSTKVIESEAGGITQHIGAYQAEKNNRLVTFIDTPGHEAFTAMRSRGAKVADVAILVVAADDGVKPQTIEAYRIIENAKIPFVVAINKIDKEGADINKAMQDLSSKLNLLPEEWGGKVITAPISAKQREGLDKLLDIVLLLSDTEVKSLKANPHADATGTIVESHVDKTAGPVATILIQNGTLHVGDQLCFEDVIYGKVKALSDYKGDNIKSAGPSVPVRVLGLKITPKVGDMMYVGDGKKVKSKKIKYSENRDASEASNDNNNSKEQQNLNVVIKSDVLGSAEAIEESLLKLNSEKMKVKVLNKSLGNINESDIKRAENSDAIILGFNVSVNNEIQEHIREKNIRVEMFSVIYDLIKFVKEEMQKLVVPEIVKKDIGKIKVLKIFRTENKNQIIGGKVIEGEAQNNSKVEVIREGKFETQGEITQLQSGKQDVDKVELNQECGLNFAGSPVVQEDDVLELYKEESIKITL